MGNLSPEDKKEELIYGLIGVRERILALAEDLSVENQSKVYLGVWSVREMLAHLAGWDETNIEAVDEILTGKLPSFYKHSGRDWAGYNEILVDKYSRNNYDQLIFLVRATHASLVAKLEALNVDDFWKDGGIRARGWKVTIGRLMEAELRGEEKHYSQLLSFIENDIGE